jgi:hypothetical protein
MRFARFTTVALAAWLAAGRLPCPAQHGDAKSQEAPRQGDAAAHADPHGEHAVALRLFRAADAAHVAKQNGDWSDPDTWDHGVPAAGAGVFIPKGFRVTVGRKLEPVIDWLRIEGTLEFTTDADTELHVSSILIPRSGRLVIGTDAKRLDADKTATILFTPRSSTHRQNDSYDLTGGLVAMGQVQLHGSAVRSFAIAAEPMTQGTLHLAFTEAPRGWKVGDVLLFPASSAGTPDEERTIAARSADGKTITLSTPLEADHVSPDGITKKVPVGNLSRNIVIASQDPESIAHRAHLMFMTHDAVHLEGAMFRGLGRTVTTRIHTLPEKNAQGMVDTGDNMIGRYAVHFHLRGGALLKRAPHRFIGNVIFDSPKHGLVNHGAYVVAENNVTYAIHGSHFFAENGSEIGVFRDNMAVWSKGSGDKIRARECRYDFGHGGHGFWAQSPAVVMQGNYAFHHADAAYSIFARPVLEFGKAIQFDRKNLIPELAAAADTDMVSPGSIPFHFEGNSAGNSGKGLEVWNVNTYARHNVPSVIADCMFWETPNCGIDIPYTFNTQVLHTIVLGRLTNRYPSAGIQINSATKFLLVDDVRVGGFATGIEIPRRGHTMIRGSRLDNAVNLRITSPLQAGRLTVLSRNHFYKRLPGDADYFLADPDCTFNGDLSLMFDRDLILVDDDRFPDQTLYFAAQHPEAVPLPASEVEQLRDKTAQQLWTEYGLAIAGGLAPAEAEARPGVRGLVGPIGDTMRKEIEDTAAFTFADEMAAFGKADGDYTLDQNYDRVRFKKGKPDEPSGWRLETTREGGQPHTRMYYVDSTPPHFELSPCMKLEIHPDDVKYGIEICGVLHDEVAGKKTIKNMIKEFHDLKVDPDGYVTINFCCADAVGNCAEHAYRFKVTEDAVKRGSNIGHYNQRAFMPPEAEVTPGASAFWSRRWFWLGGIGLAVMLLTLAVLVLRPWRLFAKMHEV